MWRQRSAGCLVAVAWCSMSTIVGAGCAGGASEKPAPILWPTGADGATTVADGSVQTAERHRRPDFATAGPPEWRVVDSPTDTTLRAVWGSASDDVWAVGDSNTILHFDGSGWAVAEEGGSSALRTVWCHGSGEAWAGGDEVLLHRDDGEGWRAWTDGPIAGKTVLGLWGADTSHVWAVGYDGAWRFDGQTWQAASPDPPLPLASVWGLSAADVWAVAGAFFHHDGRGWSKVDDGFGVLLGGIWGAAADDVWAVGHGNTLAHYDGAAWTLLNTVDMDRPHYYHVWGSAPDEIWIVGEGGTIEHYDGDSWGTWPGPTGQALLGIWGSAPDEVWAVGVGGTILRYH